MGWLGGFHAKQERKPACETETEARSIPSKDGPAAEESFGVNGSFTAVDNYPSGRGRGKVEASPPTSIWH